MLIGLGYKKRTGKDTVGRLLKDIYGFEVLSFATPLKDLCFLITAQIGDGAYQKWLASWAAKHGLYKEHEVYQILSKKDIPPYLYDQEDGKYRALLQWVGTDLIRERYCESFWIDALSRQLPDTEDARLHVAVTDVRFPNEKEWVESRGIAVEVKRDTGLSDKHRSENALDGVDWSYIIDNNGDMDNLAAQVRELYLITEDA